MPDSNDLQLQQQQGTPAPAPPLEQPQQQQQPNFSMVPPPDGLSNEMKLAKLEWEMTALKREIEEQRQALDTLNNEKDRLMKWGIMALGAAVLGMGTWIFNFIFSHIGKV